MQMMMMWRRPKMSPNCWKFGVGVVDNADDVVVG